MLKALHLFSSTHCSRVSASLGISETKTRIPTFFKQHTQRETPPMQGPLHGKKRPSGRDPLLKYLKEQRLPVVWVVGIPTHRISDTRRAFCSAFAEKHDLAYIDLDDFIERWRKRQPEAVGESTAVDVPLNLNETTLAKVFPDEVPSSTRPRPPLQELAVLPPCSPAALPQPTTTPLLQPQRRACNDAFPRISFDGGKALSLRDMLDLVKFAMLESLPAKGFVVENFPLDLGDEEAFEKTFYPPALGIYFSESYGRKAGTGKAIGPLGRNLRLPRSYKRRKAFNYARAEELLEGTAHQIIRVTNAEVLTNQMLSLLEVLLENQLLSKRKCRSSRVEGDVDNARSIGEELTKAYTPLSQSWARETSGSVSFESEAEKQCQDSAMPSTSPQRPREREQASRNESAEELGMGHGEEPSSQTSTDAEETSEEGTPHAECKPTERIKKQRMRFTNVQEEDSSHRTDSVGGDELSRCSSEVPGREEESRAEEEENLGRGGHGSESDWWAGSESDSCHYTDDWEVESPSDDDRVQTPLQTYEITTPAPSAQPLPPTPRPLQPHKSLSPVPLTDRSTSPDAHTDFLFTAARMSLQSSSNESIHTEPSRRRGRSRVKRTRRLDFLCNEGGEPRTVYEYSSAPKSIGRQKRENPSSDLPMEGGDMDRTFAQKSVVVESTSEVPAAQEPLTLM